MLNVQYRPSKMSVTYLGYKFPETEEEVRLEIAGVETAIGVLTLRKAELESGLLWKHTNIEIDQEKPNMTSEEMQAQTNRLKALERKEEKKAEPVKTMDGLKSIVKGAATEAAKEAIQEELNQNKEYLKSQQEVADSKQTTKKKK